MPRYPAAHHPVERHCYVPGGTTVCWRCERVCLFACFIRFTAMQCSAPCGGMLGDQRAAPLQLAVTASLFVFSFVYIFVFVFVFCVRIFTRGCDRECCDIYL